MKDNYFEILLLVLIVIVGIQGYYLYNINNSIKDKQISGGEYSLSIPTIRSFDDFFENHSDSIIEMDRLRRNMEKNFMDLEDLFQTTSSLNKFSSELYRIPRLDMKEKDSKYIVIMEIPGIDKNAIDIKIEKDQLIVSAKVSREKDSNTTSYYRHERHTSSYKRIVTLPSDADEKSLTSDYKDGLLTLTLNKKIP